MNLKDLLPKVGVQTFIEFFEDFKSNQTNQEIIKKFEEKYDWKDGAKRTKASKGKGIFRRSLELDALLYVMNEFNQDKIDNGKEIVASAVKLYNKYSKTEYIEKDNLFITKTEKDYLMKIRINQGKFRKDLIDMWGSCSVSGCTNKSLLVASHIKPWRNCNNYERLDKYNGLLLTPNLDKLFDNFFISFGLEGNIIISKNLKEEDLELLNIKRDSCIVKDLDENHKEYLLFHNKELKKREIVKIKK